MTDPLQDETDLPIACDLTAIPASERAAHVNVSLHVFEQATAVLELPAGYAFRFANVPGMLMQLAHFVEHERRCCQFFAFAIELEPAGGPLWLKLTGGEGVKEFVQAVFGDIRGDAAQKLIKTGDDVALRQAVDESAPILAKALAEVLAKVTQS